MSVCIVIPIYNPQPTADEVLSLKQCLHILGHYPIHFVHPASLDLRAYKAIASQADYEVFDEKYFDGVMGYNELMLTPSFYEHFNQYDFMLIYQLDAWVFSDQLKFWCNAGYDYIGAPDYGHKTTYVSWYNGILGGLLLNGGLSLRKVKKCILLTKLYQRFFKKGYGGFEDSYFSAHYSRFIALRPFIKLPDYNTALKFAFEKAPSEEFKLNGENLPFGCHAYVKFEPEFWKQKGITLA